MPMTASRDPVHAVLGIPLVPALLLVFVPRHRLAARINVPGSFLTFLDGLSLFRYEVASSELVFIDDFNIYLVVLTTFVAFTTSVFSASYIDHEVEIGRLTPIRLRSYHAMYQAFILTMLLALVANNLGVMWVAVEGATLTTVLMVSLYRTHQAIEAAWKYFILCGVGIALALFGTILMYLAAHPVLGSGMEALACLLLFKKVAASI